MTLTPAYGRDYKSAAAAVADLQSGKDFILADFSSPWDGMPINKRDIPAGTTVRIRFASLRKITTTRLRPL